MNAFEPVAEVMARLNAQGMRFWLEEDTIRFDGPESLIDSDDFNNVMARTWETIESLERASRPDIPAVIARKRTGRLPISKQQEAFFGAAADTRFASYSYAYKIQGRFDVRAFELALGALCDRHEIFRTHYPRDIDGPHAVIEKAAPISVSRRSLQELAESARSKAIDDAIDQFRLAPFDLSQTPLFRCQLLETGPDERVLQIVFHFAVMDPFAQWVVSEELAKAYNAALAGRRPDLGPPPLQYVDYAIWEQEVLSTFDKANLRVDWARALEDAPVPRFPDAADAAPTRRAAVRFPEGFKNVLLDYSMRNRAPNGAVLCYAIGALIAKRSGLTRTSIGLTATNRPVDCGAMPGPFVACKPLIVDISDDPNASTFAAQARRAFNDAHAITNPIDYELVQTHKLGSVHLYYGSAAQFGEHLPAPGFDGATTIALPSRFPRWSASLYGEFVETLTDLKGRISYTEGVMSESDAASLAGLLPVFLNRLAAAPDARLSTLWP